METKLTKSKIQASGVKLNALAAALGVDKATVSRWCAKAIPAERVKAVSELTGIPKHELRPDIFEPAQ